jgi:hypothetical protein
VDYVQLDLQLGFCRRDARTIEEKIAEFLPVYADENKLWRFLHNEDLSWVNLQYKDGTILIDENAERNTYSVELPERIDRVDVFYTRRVGFYKLTFSGS